MRTTNLHHTLSYSIDHAPGPGIHTSVDVIARTSSDRGWATNGGRHLALTFSSLTPNVFGAPELTLWVRRVPGGVWAIQAVTTFAVLGNVGTLRYDVECHEVRGVVRDVVGGVDPAVLQLSAVITAD